MTQSTSKLEYKPYDKLKGVTGADLYKRKLMLDDHPCGMWKQGNRGLAPAVSSKLEQAFISGELRVGLWDNGLFREFDLAKMQEMPGLRELQRVKQTERPRTSPA